MRVRLYEIYDSFIFCKWIKNQCGVKKDKEGFISVDFNRLGYQYDPFILANREAKQVFYITDPANKKWHVVLPDKRRIVGVGDIVDKDGYDHFDEIPPFSTRFKSAPITDNDDTNYLHSDHEEGVWVKRQSKKNS
jgi:Domain of unknown function (DUF4216)